MSVTEEELYRLRKDVAYMRQMPRVQRSGLCEILLELVDALEAEVDRPYDDGWYHKLPELGAVLGHCPASHPSNIIADAVGKLTPKAEDPS